MQPKQPWLLISASSLVVAILSLSLYFGLNWFFAGYLPLLLSAMATVLAIIVLIGSEQPFIWTKLLATLGLLLGILGFLSFFCFLMMLSTGL
jgi:hypothetical protein